MNGEASFPKGFLWGAATSSYQVEGGIEGNDWAEAARQGRIPRAGRACDHYGRYEEDFDIAQQLGHTAHRFSIEWSRVEPREGEFDERELEHYRDVLRALRARGMTANVSLTHWTEPLWFAHSGGFLRADAPEVFARYCRRVVVALGEEATFWTTLNEPMVRASHGYYKGEWPPFMKNPVAHMRVISALARAHRAAYRAIHEVSPRAQVGIAKHNIFFESDVKPWNYIAARVADWFWNHRFLALIAGHQDFIGLNHYFHVKYGETKAEHAALRQEHRVSDMGWEVHPWSLYECLVALKRYNLPVYVTEHGIADADDTRRERFVREVFAQLRRALSSGVDVRGYHYWSLLDNFEWTHGFAPRFGLVEIDYATRSRRVRPSAHVFASLIAETA